MTHWGHRNMGRGRFGHFLVAAAALLGAAQANHAWNNYHWVRIGSCSEDGLKLLQLVRDSPATSLPLSSSLPQARASSSPFVVKLVSSLISPYPLVMSGVAGKWSSASPDWSGPLSLRVAVEAGVTDGTTRLRCAPITGKVHVCNANYGAGNGWLGVASLWLDASGHISAGTVRMNDGYLLKAGGTYNSDVVRRHVMCQEVGHTFGLAHQYGVAGSALQTGVSCMNDMGSTLKSEAHTVPNGHDWEQLAAIYGAHSDGYNSFGRMLLRAARRAAGAAGDEAGAAGNSLRGGSDAAADADAKTDAEAAVEAAWTDLVAEVPVRAGATWEAHDAADVEVCLAAADAASPIAKARFLVSDYGEGRVVVTHVMRAQE